MYITSRMKDAIEDGVMWYGSFYTTLNNGNSSESGYQTRQFAVNDDIVTTNTRDRRHESTCYTITHKKSGLALWGFDCHHIACNFALELEEQFPEFDKDADAYLNEGVKPFECVEYCKTRGNHDSQAMVRSLRNNKTA